jgi:hypothetical protein
LLFAPLLSTASPQHTAKGHHTGSMSSFSVEKRVE